MIQQALTVYVDKLPIYYFDTNKIQIGNSFGEIKSKTTTDAHLQMNEGRVRIQRGNLILQNGAGKSCAEVFYEDLFDKILYCMISSDTKTTEQLGEIRREILNETDIVSLAVHFNIFRFWVKKKFEQLKEKYDKWQSENGDQSQREFNLLLADLDQLTDEDHKLSRILSLYSCEEIQTIRQMNIQQNSFSSFLNHRAKQLSFDLFGITEERLQRIRGKENTLLKKMETIAGLLDLNEEKAERWFGSVENKNRLIYVMSYYLATKMLRNRSNHANEDDAKVADDELKEFFQSRQLPVLQGICSENKIIIDTSYRGIHDLLYSGIRFSQAEWQIPIDLGL